MTTLADLSAPFRPEAIHWRAQNVTDRNGGSALALAYIDARDVMDRLDEVCGPSGWKDSYIETVKGRVLCELSILVPELGWVSKSDGAGDTDVEGEKGAISDALKRAAVKWGIGRYLYDLGNVWAPCELAMKDGKPLLNNKNKPTWRAWKPEAQDIFAKALAKVGKPTGPINDTTRDWLQAQIEAAGSSPQALLQHFTPASLKALTFEQMPEAKRFLDNLKQKKAA